MSTKEEETKITFCQPDGQIRILRGILIDSDDPDFIILKRRDGVKRIARRFVITIEEPGVAE